MNPIDVASQLATQGRLDDAEEVIDRVLKRDPNNGHALAVMTFILLKMPRPSIAYQCGKRATELAPKLRAAWINFGNAAQDLWFHAEAKRAYLRALDLCEKDSHAAKVLLNLSACEVDIGHFEEGKRFAERVLELDPDNEKARANLGFAQLALREWKEGWKNYRYALLHDTRHRMFYGDEPEWDGSPGKRVVVYGEQGIGDEISFASVIPEAQEICKNLVFDCHPKLETLFRRSFPGVKVYGTRKQKELEWDTEDREIDASLAVGQLSEYFRLTDESFPGTPYLVPDPDKVVMWKALFETKKKPSIGIAWRGGLPRTGSRFRQWDLEQLLPIFQAVDAHWVSLQYKPAKKEILEFNKKYPEIEIHEYPHATLGEDYDDTAALVASLDMVVCIQTAVAHLAGALGTPVWVFVPQNSQWRYGAKGESIPWYNSLKVIRQSKRGRWDDDIKRVAKDLKRRFREDNADIRRVS